MKTRERNSINYNNPPQSNQESSPRLSTAPLISSPTSTTRRNETHDHLHQGNHYHGFKLHKELEAQRPKRNLNPDPDPVRLASPIPSQPLPISPHPSTAAAAAVVVQYRECLKNYGANMGTHVLDGCGEFMPGGDDDTPEALKCAACECHRSFHRREVEGESKSGYRTQHMPSPISMTHNPPPGAAVVQLPPAPSSQQQHHRYHHPMPPIMMAFGGTNGAPAESFSEDLNLFRTYAGVHLMAQTSKKRFRSKFTEEQKEKMHDFAERIGWKTQKHDEQEVLQFCNEVGLKKKVFKVWMHNNRPPRKNNFKIH